MLHDSRDRRLGSRLAAHVPLLLAWLFAGCAPHAAVARFSREFRCPTDQVQMEDLGARAYRVTGCNRSATYVCLTNDLNPNAGICSLDAQPEAAAAPATAGGSEEEDVRPQQAAAQALAGRMRIGSVEVPALRMSLSGMPLTFAMAPGADPPSILVFISTSYAGQAERCADLELSGGGARLSAPREAAEAVRFRVPADALQAVTRGDSLHVSACRRSMWLSAPQRIALARFARVEADTAGAPSDAAAAPPPSDVDAAARVRALLEERRQTLLACVSQDVVGVRVRWDAAGSVTVSLNGPLAGSPDEACVRSQLERLSIPAGAPAGELVHALTR